MNLEPSEGKENNKLLNSEEDIVNETEKFVDNFLQRAEDFQQKIINLAGEDRFLESLLTEHAIGQPGILAEEHVQSSLALHHGRAFNLFLRRGDSVRLPIILPSDSHVQDLYRAVMIATNNHIEMRRKRFLNDLPSINQMAVELTAKRSSKKDKHERRCLESVDISCLQDAFTNPPPPPSSHLRWRQFWRTHAIGFVSSGDLSILTDKSKQLVEFPDLKSGAVLHFVRRRKRLCSPT